MTKLIIIVGAPRSGTNMLRDVLTDLPGMATWPCDEINPLWKHGNLRVPHDELSAGHATDRVKRDLRRAFAAEARRLGCEVLVEKTCANSLRLDFVAEVFPEAHFVFIHRDGFDAAASTMKRWNARVDLRYTLRKVRFVPVTDIPRHAWWFARSQVNRLRSGQWENDAADLRVASWWGPRPRDYRALAESFTLEEVALMQWERCLSATLAQSQRIPGGQWHPVRYEDFVQNPVDQLHRVLRSVGEEERFTPTAVGRVQSGSVGKSRVQYPAAERARLARWVRETMRELGYPEEGLA